MTAFNVGDRVRRLSDWQKVNGWPYGDAVLVVSSTKYDGYLQFDPARDGSHSWSPANFERVIDPTVGDMRTPDGGSTFEVWADGQWRALNPVLAPSEDDGWHDVEDVTRVDTKTRRLDVADFEALGLEVRVQTRFKR